MSEIEIVDTPAGPAGLKRSNRRTLAISVLPNGVLELIAPQRAELADVVKKVVKRSSWIARQRRAFLELNATRPAGRYVSGATHRYLGRQYRLKVAKGDVSKVALKGAYLLITLPKIDEARTKDALEQWYRHQARQQFEKRLGKWEEWCLNRKLPMPRLRLLRMPKRWGSALKDGTICLTPELIQAPSACVDYVICHEICHLKYPDHGRGFWALLQQLCPTWKQLKARLERQD